MKSSDRLAHQFEGIANPLGLLEELTARSPMGILVSKKDGSVVLTNPAFDRLIGADVWRPERYREKLERAFNGETCQSKPHWHRKGGSAHSGSIDGDDVAISATFVPIFENERDVLYVAVLIKDESIEERARLATGDAEERLRGLFEAIADPVYIFDFVTNRIEAANPAWCRQFGYEMHEAIGMPMLNCSGEPELSRAGIEQTVRSSEHAYLIPLRWMKRKDGTTFPTEISGSRFTLNGQVKIVGSVRDITERRKAEQALRESESKFRQIAESIQEVFWISSPDSGVIHYVSPAYEKIWGRTPESLYAQPSQWIECMHPDDRMSILERLRSKARGEYQAEYRIIRPDGSTRWIRDRGFPVQDSEGKLGRMAGIALDVTEQRQLSEQLSQSQKLEAIGRLAGGVSHDFNNMITAILGYADVLTESLPANDERRADLGEIRKTADRAGMLTKQLLAFSRQQVMEPRVLSMNVLVLETKGMLQRLIGEDVDMRHILAGDLGMVYADPGQLGQVILNLVVNARDAMPNGGKITIETANVQIGANDVSQIPGLTVGDYTSLSITDTGEGIDQKNLPKIFEPFFTTKEKGKGTGLGLSTVYGVIKQCGGAVTVQSERGVGTNVKVYLPRVKESTPTYEGAPKVNTESARGTGRILLVEDEEGVRHVTTRILTRSGYIVESVGSAAEAIALFKPPLPRFDLLITDVIMPDMNGTQLAKKIHVLAPGLKTLFMSGYTDEAIAHKGLLEPGLQFLAKPFSAISITQKIKEILGS